MEVIQINGEKVKVVLTKADLVQYDFKSEAWNCISQESHDTFRHILESVEEKTGFDASSSRVFVEAFPDKSGGCELYVTKLKSGVNGDSLATVCNVYAFETLRALLDACRHLRALGCKEESRAYALQDSSECYLLICDASVGEDGKLHYAYPVLSDYGTRKTAVGILTYLKEHCNPLCESDAVGVLGAL
jgi:negative regulator of genetic competence, sporulation and motility